MIASDHIQITFITKMCYTHEESKYQRPLHQNETKVQNVTGIFLSEYLRNKQLCSVSRGIMVSSCRIPRPQNNRKHEGRCLNIQRKCDIFC